MKHLLTYDAKHKELREIKIRNRKVTFTPFNKQAYIAESLHGHSLRAPQTYVNVCNTLGRDWDNVNIYTTIALGPF